jgi:Protein of unknown function (DUF1700)
MMTDSQGLIDRYLKELERELSALPRGRRREVMDDVRAHISEARSEAGNDEAAVRELLDRLGDPVEIAADARERFGVRPSKVGFMEVAALIMLPIGGLVVPVIGWIAGVILLWSSPAWLTRDKLIGTLVVPGGLLPAFALVSLATYSGDCNQVLNGRGRVIEETCTGGGPSGLEQFGLWLLLAFLVIGPIASAIYLGVRLRRRPAFAN